MSVNSKIEWTDRTFNPWEGCQKMGPGCDHRYAETRNARFGGGQAMNWGPGAPRRRTSPATWAMPRPWNAQADAFMAQHGRRQRVFCASLADVFDSAVDPQWRADLFALIRDTPNLDWLLLTKRIGNVPAMVAIIPGWLPDNVWLGATITSQIEADRDIPKLLAVPVRVRFLSMEPLLGPVDLTVIDINGDCEIYPLLGTTQCVNEEHEPAPDLPALDWVIVGGESGPSARPMSI
jgi:protein gp37